MTAFAVRLCPFLALVFSWCLSTVVWSAPLEDLIESLPLYGQPPTTQFSGYLDASAGCDVEVNGPICKIHYWLALAEVEDPLNAPVVLWLNGGPGSSSVIGFLQENGPLLMNATGGLMKNPWSWTKVANLLILESPLGVGYSYCSRQLEGLPCINSDKRTATASTAALVEFFDNKFPELATNDFFITGESYAGVYIPTLAKTILDTAAGSINLVGIAVGDPCTDNDAQNDSMDSLWYGHKYGLVDDAIFDKLWNQCSLRFPKVWAMGGPHWVAEQLNQELRTIHHPDHRQARAQEMWNELRLPVTTTPMLVRDDPACNLAYRKFVISSSHALSQSWADLYIDDYSLFAPVTNQEMSDMVTYMRRPDVRAALHVEESPNTNSWPGSGVGFNYTKEYFACNWAYDDDDDDDDDLVSMIDFYRDIAPRLLVTWVYNGDTDPCVSYEGTVTAIKRVGFAELDGGGYRPWFYRHDATSLQVLAEKAPRFGPDLLAQAVGPQLGGEVVNYENGLAFLTVHGSGHMVPQFRPQASLHMLNRLVHLQDLSPLMPSNATLAAMSPQEFNVILDQWTEWAKSSSYVDDDDIDHDSSSSSSINKADVSSA